MDFTPYLPVFDSQDSFVTHTDFMDCVSMSAIHIIETKLNQSGVSKHYSPRALAKLAGTTKDGVSLQAVIDAINKYGLIPYEFWPDPRDLDWAQYYAAIPPEVLAKAEKFNVSFSPATLDDLATDPLWIIVEAGNTTHIVEQINETQIFDSETDSQAGAIRPITTYGPVIRRYKIKLNNLNLNPMQLYKFDDNPTEYVLCEDTLLGIASEQALAKITLGRPTRLVTLPAAQRSNFVIATGAYN